LTVLALRPFTALIGPASLTLFRAVIAPAKAVAVAAVAVTTVAIAAFRAGLLGARCGRRLGDRGSGLSVLNQLKIRSMMPGCRSVGRGAWGLGCGALTGAGRSGVTPCTAACWRGGRASCAAGSFASSSAGR